MARFLGSGGDFRSVGGASTMASSGLDLELHRALRELKLDRYQRNFVVMKVIYSDLPLLSSEILEKLIPHEIPRLRLVSFIKENFVTKKGGEGWEIDANTITPDKKEKKLGAGGFGSISTGNLEVGTTKIKVALKSIQIDGRNVTKEAVINEVKVMNRCHHPNVLKCFGCYFAKDERSATICLEYLPEGDLLDFTEKFNVPMIQKLGYLVDVARGLRYLHKKNIVHRDIKPANILIFHGRGSAKICDFGSSKLESQIGKTFCGTPEYMCPEIYSGEEIEDPQKIDVYAFGILMWEVFCDENPYEHLHRKYPGSPMRVLRAIHGKKVMRPNLKNKKLKKISTDFLDLMEVCWEVDPSERPPMSEVYDELKMNLTDMKGEEIDSAEEDEEDED